MDRALDLICKCFALKRTCSKCFAGRVVKWRPLIGQSLSATHILLPQQPNLNVIERKFKRQILKPDPIILDCAAYSQMLIYYTCIILQG